MASRPIRLCFLIRMLDCGGAERQLAELVGGLDKARFEVTVLTFYPGGMFWSAVEEMPGVELVCLGKTGRWDVGRFVARLVGFLRRRRPDIVHGYLGIANELAWLGGRASGARVVWGLRASNRDLDRYDWSFRASLRVSARLSRHVDLVIANSHAGVEHHLRHGFCRRNITVVPNGIDTGRFRPRPEARQRLRQQWGVQDSEFLIGLVGRRDPMKDHETFFEAMVGLADRHSHVRVACVGDRAPQAGDHLAGSRAARALGARLRWAPAREDVERVLPALDGLVLSSAYGEGFPNVVGEAMAAEVPCVVTDVGDAATLLADPQRTVPPRDPGRLMDACERLLGRTGDERRRLAANDRRRIEEHFTTAHLVQRTTALLERVAAGADRPADAADISATTG